MSVQEDYLTGIANAIRTKEGSTDPIQASQFASRIEAITTTLPTQEKTIDPSTTQVVVEPDEGKTLSKVTVSPIQTETATVWPATIEQTATPSPGKFFRSVTVGAVPTETKSVSPSTSEQTVKPTSGKFLSQVTVGAISTETKSVSPSTSSQTVTPTSGKYLSSVTVNAISPTKSSATYTPTTYDQTISSGRWLTGTQTIKGDSNLVAGNIASGVSIFGVTGTYTTLDYDRRQDTATTWSRSWTCKCYANSIDDIKMVFLFAEGSNNNNKVAYDVFDSGDCGIIALTYGSTSSNRHIVYYDKDADETRFLDGSAAGVNISLSTSARELTITVDSPLHFGTDKSYVDYRVWIYYNA